MPQLADLLERRNHLRLQLTREADVYGVVLPCNPCSVCRLQIPYDIPASSTVNRLTCNRIDLDVFILILILHLTFQLPYHKSSNPPPHLDCNRPISSYP